MLNRGDRGCSSPDDKSGGGKIIQFNIRKKKSTEVLDDGFEVGTDMPARSQDRKGARSSDDVSFPEVDDDKPVKLAKMIDFRKELKLSGKRFSTLARYSQKLSKPPKIEFRVQGQKRVRFIRVAVTVARVLVLMFGLFVMLRTCRNY